MNINYMRDCVAKAYKGKGWSDKVAKMKAAQIIAIYYNLQKRRVI